MKFSVLSLLSLSFLLILGAKACDEFYSPCNAVGDGLWYAGFVNRTHEGNCYYCASMYNLGGALVYFAAFTPANTECHYCPSYNNYAASTNQCCPQIGGNCASSYSVYGTHVPGTPQCNCQAGDQWLTQETCVNCLIWYLYYDINFGNCTI